MRWAQSFSRNILIHRGGWKSKTKDMFLSTNKNVKFNGYATLIVQGQVCYCYKVPNYTWGHCLLVISNQQRVYYSPKAMIASKPRQNKQRDATTSSQSVSENPAEEDFSENVPLLDSDSTLEELRSKLRPGRKKCSYVFKQNVAEMIVTAMLKHRENPFAPVLDIGAGPGLVSRELLKQGVSKVVAVEKTADFIPSLLALQSHVGSARFSVFNFNMLNLYMKMHISPYDKSFQQFQKIETEVATSLKETPSAHDSSEVPYSVLSLGDKENNEQFIYYVTRNLPNEDTVLFHDQIEFFFLAHPKFKYKIDCIAAFCKQDAWEKFEPRDKTVGTFSYTHAFIYLLYDVEIIGQINLNDVFPPFNSSKTRYDKHFDPSKRLLMRMQLKKNIADLLPLQHHTPFMNFLCQLYRKKSIRIVPAMEMLVPGCGLQMLAEGFSMMEMISVTNPKRCLELYKKMLEWPEYTSSPLHRHLMMKMTGSVEDDSLSDGDH